MKCWKCNKEIQIEKISRTTECPVCHADLHACKGCKFYAPGNHFDCKESVDEVIVDKDKSNFCDFFESKIITQVEKESASDKAKAAAARLFGDSSLESTQNTSAKDAFDALFK